MQPHSHDRMAHLSAVADVAACRALLRTGSRTFYAASFLLPRRVREPASCLYAFCRQADDAIDLGDGGQTEISHLKRRLDLAYEGRPYDTPIDRAFAATVECFGIPHSLPAALLDGLAWDTAGRRYEDIDALTAYGARVAGTVGAMMAVLMGVRAPDLVARACDLGVAMQLTNIARDVGEDARAGRIYLPLAWLREAGIDPNAWIAAPRFTRELAAVIVRLLDVADTLYDRADAGIAALPVSCRPGIRAARFLYAEIGHELRRNGLNSISRRTVVPVQTKLSVLWRASSGGSGSRLGAAEPCLPQAQFLLDGLENSHSPSTRALRLPWWDLHAQAVRAIEIFEQLEQRERDTYAEQEPKRMTA
jgi:15-cis-phytoene synthase